MGRWIRLRDLDGLTFFFSKEGLIDFHSEHGQFGPDLVEMAFLLGPFERRPIDKAFHVQHSVVTSRLSYPEELHQVALVALEALPRLASFARRSLSRLSGFSEMGFGAL